MLSVFHGRCLNRTNHIVPVLDILNINVINNKSQANVCLVLLIWDCESCFITKANHSYCKIINKSTKNGKQQPFTPKHRELWVCITQWYMSYADEVKRGDVDLNDRLTDDLYSQCLRLILSCYSWIKHWFCSFDALCKVVFICRLSENRLFSILFRAREYRQLYDSLHYNLFNQPCVFTTRQEGLKMLPNDWWYKWGAFITWDKIAALYLDRKKLQVVIIN